MLDPLTRQLIDEFDAHGPTPLFHALSYAWSYKTCVGYGSPANGRICGRERDDDRQWCDDCAESAALDQGNIHFDYPHLMDR